MSKNLIKAAYDENGEVVSIEPEDFYSGYDAERMIYGLNVEEATVLFLKHCGYTPIEIVEIMGLKKIKQYYKISCILRKKTEDTIHKPSKIYDGINKENEAKRKVDHDYLMKRLRIQKAQRDFIKWVHAE